MNYIDEITTGFWVDQDGKIRRVEAPGEGYACRICSRDGGYLGIDVIDSEGFVAYEAVYYRTLQDLFYALQGAGSLVLLSLEQERDFKDAAAAISNHTYDEVHVSASEHRLLFIDARDFLPVASTLIGAPYSSVKNAAQRLLDGVPGRGGVLAEVAS